MSKKNIEAIYPLVPMQQALLWHSLQPGQSNLGFLQMRCTLQGNLHVTLLKQAWEQVVSRHPTLRTSVHWQDLKAPLQVVYKKVSLPWEDQDWREATATELQAQLADFLQGDRQKGLDLSQAPIMRLTLIRTAEQTYQLIWSCHHLLLDGWSGAIAFKEMLEFYEALSQGQQLSLNPACTYRQYVNWLQQEDINAAEEFWREYLRGFRQPTPLPLERFQDRHSGQLQDTDEQKIELTEATTTALESLLRKHRLTLNALIQGAWALLLSSYSGEEDVLFGATVSGRSVALPGVETIVGLLINTLPIRGQVSPSESLISWVKTLHEQQVALSNYEHITLGQIQSWSELSGHLSLFRSLLVVENYSGFASSPSQHRSLQISEVHSGITSTYPLTVVVTPGLALGLVICYDRHYFDAPSIQELLLQFRALLESFAHNPEVLISDLLALINSVESVTLSRSSSGSVGDRRSLSVSNRTQKQLNTTLVAPRDNLERQLTEIWKKVLGIQSIGVKDNFFQLGGRSLQAARLFDEMAEALKVNIPLAAFFELSTVEQLANTLRPALSELSAQESIVSEQEWSSPELNNLSPHIPELSQEDYRNLLASMAHWKGRRLGSKFLLVEVQPGNSSSKQPLFLVGPKMTLAEHLVGLEQPIYFLPGGFITQNATTYVKALAACYVEEIRTVQPSGPYLLGGYCFGGLVAFEMAQQIQAEGQEIDLLMLVDTSGPNPIFRRFQQIVVRLEKWHRRMIIRPILRSSGHLSSRWFFHRRNLLALSSGERLPYISNLLRRVFNRDSTPNISHPTRSKEKNILPQLNNKEREQMWKILELSVQNYLPQFYSGRVALLFSSDLSHKFPLFPRRGWEKLFKENVEVHLVPGNHNNLFDEPNVQVLAEKLTSCIDSAVAQD